MLVKQRVKEKRTGEVEVKRRKFTETILQIAVEAFGIGSIGKKGNYCWNKDVMRVVKGKKVFLEINQSGMR